MKQKYFTPKRDDFNIGYEFETDYLEEDWVKKVLTASEVTRFFQLYDADAYDIEFRVPYLDKEQIEKEGWKHIGGSLSSSSKQNYEKNYFELEYTELNQNMVIKHKNMIRNGSGNHNGYIQFFQGKCPSINEFRYICKLLNII